VKGSIGVESYPGACVSGLGLVVLFCENGGGVLKYFALQGRLIINTMQNQIYLSWKGPICLNVQFLLLLLQ